MIFVTVGTHEQPFNRLLREVDRLAAEEGLPQPVFCQTGYSSYRPAVRSVSMLPYAEMQEYLSSADVVVSHGGPGSILPVLAAGKPLVLVPRQRRFHEHVDDHQVAFCRRLSRERDLPLVLDIDALAGAIGEAPGRAVASQGPRSDPSQSVEELGRLIAGLLQR